MCRRGGVVLGGLPPRPEAPFCDDDSQMGARRADRRRVCGTRERRHMATTNHACSDSRLPHGVCEFNGGPVQAPRDDCRSALDGPIVARVGFEYTSPVGRGRMHLSSWQGCTGRLSGLCSRCRPRTRLAAPQAAGIVPTTAPGRRVATVGPHQCKLPPPIKRADGKKVRGGGSTRRVHIGSSSARRPTSATQTHNFSLADGCQDSGEAHARQKRHFASAPPPERAVHTEQNQG